jgi:hypothetical protein
MASDADRAAADPRWKENSLQEKRNSGLVEAARAGRSPMTPSATRCRLCGRDKPADLPVCRDCTPAFLSRVRQRRASRDAAERKRAQKRLDRSVRVMDRAFAFPL